MRGLLRIVPMFTRSSRNAYNSVTNLSYLKGADVVLISSRPICSSTTSDRNVKLRKTSSIVESLKFLECPAIYDEFGLHKYKELLVNAVDLAEKLKDKGRVKTSREQHVCGLLCSNDSRYVYSLWGAWLSECVVVPLSGKYPQTMLEYFLDDSRADVVLYTKEFEDIVEKLHQSRPKLESHLVDCVDKNIKDNAIKPCLDGWMSSRESKDLWKKPAVVIYTSGTTGKPKGVLHTHGTLGAMVQGMLKAWDWTSEDVSVHCLPLNHVHGIVNALLTPLSCGALSVMLPRFNPYEIWKLLLRPNDDLPRKPSIFMGVPTMYSMLMNFLDHNHKQSSALKSLVIGERTDLKDVIRKTCLKNIRLFISGSAPLPLPVMDQWEDLTCHKLLERYGMTEIGMALTNPLHGPRIPGAVGLPFPFVEVAIAHKNVHGAYDILVKSDENYTQLFGDNPNDGGELLVRGDTIFKEYLNNPSATVSAFTSDGWFITGDTARYNEADQTYCIMGRTSVDVIKSGGFKLSALEIENQMARHPSIKEVAILGVPDQVWGQKVVALVVLKESLQHFEDVAELILEWCHGRMAPHQIPKHVMVVKDLQRNVMGKLNKKELLRKYFGGEEQRKRNLDGDALN